jgi:protein subunit release factor B
MAGTRRTPEEILAALRAREAALKARRQAMEARMKAERAERERRDRTRRLIQIGSTLAAFGCPSPQAAEDLLTRLTRKPASRAYLAAHGWERTPRWSDPDDPASGEERTQ